MAGEPRSRRRRAPARRGRRDADGRRATATEAPGSISAGGDIVAQLRSMLPALAPAEQRVGEIIVSDPGAAAGLTITDLAAAADTSETTVIRFCRSVGVAGYPALRLLVAAWTGRNEAMDTPRMAPEIDPGDDLASVVTRIGQSETSAVRETADGLDLAALERAVVAIAGARRIDAYGVGASGLVADDLQRKLHRIGLSTWAWPDPHMALTSAANLGVDDVVVAISHTGRTTDTIEPVAEARRRGATAIAITNFARSPLAAEADVVLATVSDEAAFRSGAMASRIAALVVVDCLFVGVATRRWASATDAILRTNQAISSRRRSPRSGRR
ncbi:MAG TPA: MurR/RpiR family transcriptional regulator [Solirubrobacteraceae bacterium]|nr:MurR/RpiR family transcriptional regulator [Solirubrobacteraceae bacterium]